MILGTVAAWPELSRHRHAHHWTPDEISAVQAQAGSMIQPRYSSVDVYNRPYTITATTAHQEGPDRVDMTDPKGDVVLQNGTWMMVQSDAGVYAPHTGLLDLSGNVVLYRQDGTTFNTSTSTLDVRKGVSLGNDMTHVEGPFGTLDAQGYTMFDKGEVIQFRGPAHLVLNAAHPG